MAQVGRKSLKEELGVIRRYADLSEPFFNFIKACLEGDDKADKKWASEQLGKGFVKMIPQSLETDPDNPITIRITGMQIIKDPSGGNSVPHEERETA